MTQRSEVAVAQRPNASGHALDARRLIKSRMDVISTALILTVSMYVAPGIADQPPVKQGPCSA